MKTEENGIWSDFAQEGLDKMQKKKEEKKYLIELLTLYY